MSGTISTSVPLDVVAAAAVPPKISLAAAWRGSWALAQREWIRFIRQGNRVLGAIGQPLIFWLLFGAGLGPTFRLGGAGDQISYREYFFPGTLVLIVLFTAIFATISIIEDRREGFLQSVLVSPLPRFAIVIGKVLGGTLLATAQAALFLILGYATLKGLSVTPLSVVLVLADLFVIGIALTALGYAIAWRMESTQGFHAIMSVFLLPMWLLSGAFFPSQAGVLGWIIWLNPLTYCVGGLRRLMYLDSPHAALLDTAYVPSAWASAVVTLLFTVAMLLLAWRISATRTAADLV